jgi:hypothetical protein
METVLKSEVANRQEVYRLMSKRKEPSFFTIGSSATTARVAFVQRPTDFHEPAML